MSLKLPLSSPPMYTHRERTPSSAAQLRMLQPVRRVGSLRDGDNLARSYPGATGTTHVKYTHIRHRSSSIAMLRLLSMYTNHNLPTSTQSIHAHVLLLVHRLYSPFSQSSFAKHTGKLCTGESVLNQGYGLNALKQCTLLIRKLIRPKLC